ERLAAVTAGGVLCVVDVQPDDPPVGQRTHETVKATLAVAAPTAHRTGVGLGLAADGNDFLCRWWPHAHGLRSQVTEVRDRCSRTQALSVNPPSTYGDSRHFRGVASTPTILLATHFAYGCIVRGEDVAAARGASRGLVALLLPTALHAPLLHGCGFLSLH